MPICPGCRQEFTSLSTHQRSCKALYKALQEGPSRKHQHQKEQGIRLAKQRKLDAEAEVARLAKEQAEAEAYAQRMAELEALQPIVLPSLSRSGRQRRVPGRVKHMVATSLTGLPEHLRPPAPLPPPLRPHDPSLPPPPAVPHGLPSVDLPQPPPGPVETTPVETGPNRFGVFRSYTSTPIRDPEEGLTVDDFTDCATHSRRPPDDRDANALRPFGASILSRIKEKAQTSFAPFLNVTVFRIMHWLYSGSALKSAAETTRLIRNVFLAEDFSRDHIVDFDAERENRRLDEYAATSDAFLAKDGWQEGSVKIRMPKEKHRHSTEQDAPEATVDNIHFRPFLEVIKAAFQDARAYQYHWFPFRLFRRFAPTSFAPASPDERMWTDIYNSDAMLGEHEEIQAKARQSREPNDDPKVEYAIAPVMVWSDSTHLTSFGTASLWPIYVFFGNLSKYIRARPTSFAAHHLAYIPSLPASIQTAYQGAYNEPATEQVLRFLKRELMQAIRSLLLDDDFLHAYEHGILIQCGDGIVRRIFPRIFTYSADYPEKCLIACIKNLGRHLCPDCLIEKDKVPSMGTVNDLKAHESHPRRDHRPLHQNIARAREMIFQGGDPVEGTHVEGLLGTTSTLPTRSAFSAKLSQFGFDVYQILVPDLMHEFELGVWKATFTHLVRILVAVGGKAVQELDERFAQIPTFGRATIRRFGRNVSAMKKFAARDFEDLVQCAWPVFEGLLPNPAHNKIVLDLLFYLATWHALAKLRLQTETTLTIFEHMTRLLGQGMRAFVRHVCAVFNTQELPKETMARHRRAGAAAVSKTGLPARGGENTRRKVPAKTKKFNLCTYKYHRLADYPRAIRLFGPTDNYTTQTGELEHRRVKKFYAHTNKNHTFVRQITRQQRREAILHRLAEQRARASGPAQTTQKRRPHRRRPAAATPEKTLRLGFHVSEPLGLSSPKEHIRISDDQRHHVNMYAFAAENRDDPACKDFVLELKKHLAARLAGEPTYQATAEDLRRIRIRRDLLHIHKAMQVNYTSYDMRIEQDSINPRTHPDVMMLAPEDDTHQYLYARVLSIFHVNVYCSDWEDQEPQPIQVLWVRWLEVDHSAPGGIQTRRPHRLKFTHTTEEPFAFLAPECILRAVHLIPAFAHGRSENGLCGPTIARTDGLDDDWKYLYVGMWSDRDLFMRFLGGAVGHIQAPYRDSDAESHPSTSTTDLATALQDLLDDDDDNDASQPLPEENGDSHNKEDSEEEDDDDEDEDEEELEQLSEEDDSDSDDDDDLGPEDGEVEEGFDAEEFESTGFAAY